jgi:hypothetical protein
MAADAGVKVTFFVTGRALAEERAKFRTLDSLGNVELAAHGWDSFRNHTARRLLWCAFGSLHGPKFYQRLEVAKTLRAFRAYLGLTPTAWRGHAYYADENTYSLLKTAGIHVVSDSVADGPIAEVLSGLWSVPINTSPDHDTLMHGACSQSALNSVVEQARAFRDLQVRGSLGRKQRVAIRVRRLCRRVIDTRVVNAGELWYASGAGIELLPARCWEEQLCAQIQERITRVGFATLLLHPVCMAALDGLATFRRVLKFCARFPSRFLSEAPLPDHHQVLRFVH